MPDHAPPPVALAVSTWNALTFGGAHLDLRDVVRDIVGGGPGIEFWPEWSGPGRELLTNRRCWAETADLASGSGPISCHGSFSPDDRDRAFLQIDFAKAVDARVLVVHPTMLGHKPARESRDAAVRFARLLVERAAPSVTIAVENCLSLDAVQNITDAVSELGVCLDTGHANLDIDHSILDHVNVFGERLVHLHIHDNHGHGGERRAPGGPDMDDLDEHLPIGEGTIDWQALGVALQGFGYAGSAVLEIRARPPAEALRSSLAALAAVGWRL